MIWNFLKDGFLIRSAWKAVIVHTLLVVLATIIYIFWFFWFSLPSITQYDKTSIVPDIKGEKLKDAIIILKDNKLRYKVIDSTFNANYDPEAVISYVPKAGEKVKENRTIYLTIRSVKAPTIIFPSGLTKGRSLNYVVRILEQNSLQIGKMTPVSYQYPIVLKTLLNGEELKGGENIPIGSEIDIEYGVSDNAPTVVPDLLNRTLLDAKKMLPNMSLWLRTIYVEKAEEDPGTIIKQTPKPGSEVNKGTEIELWVAGSEEEQPDN